MNAQASFITGTSGAEKLLGINSRGLANTHSWDQCLQPSRRWHSLKKSGSFSDAFINGGTGLSIEASPFVGLKGGYPILLMQLKMVLKDIIAYMYKVIRELWLFAALPQTRASVEVPNVKSFITLLPVNCATLECTTSKIQRRAGFGWVR